jgi:Mg2+ and Co2+ transporter CorA
MSGAMQKDSAAMKTIAVVTLAFLPPTFVSVSYITPQYKN